MFHGRLEGPTGTQAAGVGLLGTRVHRAERAAPVSWSPGPLDSHRCALGFPLHS